MTELVGFIIANRSWDEQTKLSMGMKTFGATAGEAWRRHVGYDRGLDFSTLVQRWNEKGYGPHRVAVKLSPEPSGALTEEELAELWVKIGKGMRR